MIRILFVFMAVCATNTHAFFVYDQAASFMEQGKWDEAKQQLQKLLVDKPDAPDVLYYASGNHANVYGVMRVRRENANLNNRKHEQVRFDGLQLSYYINNRGFLVARYLNEYDYSVGPA